MTDALLTRVRAWLDDDGDPIARAELEQLIASGNLSELHDRFDASLKFGTAGLRGRLGAGPNRMNRCIVARITVGLCARLSATLPNAASRGICIGFDGRHMSRQFALEAAEVALGAGFRVHRFNDVVPTPLLAHAVLQLSAAAGVMITASHNPAAYNGYKAYGHNGAQLITPDDDAVMNAASQVTSLRSLPRVALPEAQRDGRSQDVDADVARHYHADLAASFAKLGVNRSTLRIAYTALHGVGETFARTALSVAGFNDVHSVREQATPDAFFATVASPNPEEPHAMQRVLALGKSIAADLVLANDPDADRLAVAARTEDGDLRTLSGNHVGLLLTDFLLRHERNVERSCVLSSIVTTPMVARIADAYGVHWEATLTGTKWICNRALELQRSRGLTCVIGFEEAIGYCIGTSVRDKDGVAAAAFVALMAADAKQHGVTLHQALEELQRRHGLAASRQRAVTLSNSDAMTAIASRLQQLVDTPPTTIGAFGVQQVIDLSRGRSLPPTPGLILELEQERRICIRPSGTEPKLKCYLDARVVIAPGEPYAAAQARAEMLLDDMSRALDTLLPELTTLERTVD